MKKTLLIFISFFFFLIFHGKAQCVLQQQSSSNVTCNGGCDGIAIFSVSGGTSPYTISVPPLPDIMFGTTGTVANLCAGAYTYTITDQLGCQLLGQFLISSPPPITISFSVINPSCQTCNDGSISPQVSGGVSPYTFLWSNGATNITLFGLTAGLYTLYVTDANGCTTTSTILLGGGGTNGYMVSGIVFFDTDSNGVQDVNEPGLAGQPILISPLNWTGYTNVNGEYYFVVPDGSYSVDYTIQSGWSLTTSQAGYPINVNGANIPNLDFGTKPFILLDSITANLTGGAPRCAFNVYQRITYKNTGTFIAPSVKLDLTLDAFLTYTTSSIAPDSILGNRLVWMRPGLLPGQQYYIDYYVTMPALTGTPLSTNLTVTSFDSSGNQLAVSTASLNQTVTCSYDPNDKAVVPEGLFAQHETPMNSWLDYTIRFQNTGNDTAFTVVLRDTLDVNVDPSTFEIITSSHIVNTRIENNGLLTFTFDNILLPDSIVDEPGSHGFVRYRIKPLENLPDPTVIYNTAYIYFDFNSAIVTNTTFNTFTDIVNSAAIISSLNDGINVYPNPANDKINVTINSDNGRFLFKVISADGRIIRTGTINQTNTIQLNVHDVAAGVYLLQVKEETTNQIRQKTIIISK